jgi:hypothetical protein
MVDRMMKRIDLEKINAYNLTVSEKMVAQAILAAVDFLRTAEIDSIEGLDGARIAQLVLRSRKAGDHEDYGDVNTGNGTVAKI